MKCNIFYSWQSDLPNKDNRSFIEHCILKSIKKNETDIKAGITIVYGRDTSGTSGSEFVLDPDFYEIT